MRTVHRYVRVEPWSNHRRSVAVRLTENRGFIGIVLLIATIAGETRLEKYAYRRFGSGPELPLLCLQHFTGTPAGPKKGISDSATLTATCPLCRLALKT
jgi:hypothetical protein